MIKESNKNLQITLDKKVVDAMDKAIVAINQVALATMGGKKETRSSFIQHLIITFISDLESINKKKGNNKKHA